MARQGIRSAWGGMPKAVQNAVDTIAGSPVIEATNLEGGFSPGPAARCTLSNGRIVFVKAAGTELNPVSPEMHRREGQILAALEADVPAPNLIGVFDDGDWVALVIEWIDGAMPTAPLIVVGDQSGQRSVVPVWGSGISDATSSCGSCAVSSRKACDAS